MDELLLQHTFTSITVLVTAGILLLYHSLKYLVQKNPSFDAPVMNLEGTDAVGSERYTRINKMVQDNFSKYQNDFFKIEQPQGEMVIVPKRYIQELKSLPDAVLSLKDEIDDKFLARYTGLNPEYHGGDPQAIIKSIKNDLTRSISNLMEDLHDETVYAFGTGIGPCPDWTEINVTEKMLRIVALVSGRVFAGPELNRNEDYLLCLITYTVNVFQAATELFKFSVWIRPLASYMIPEMRAVRRSEATMQKAMAPVIQKREEELARGEKKSNMMSWNLQNSKPESRKSTSFQAQAQLVAPFAAIHTTTMQLTHAIFDIAARPEYLASLRAEITTIMATETTPYLSKASMPKLKKLDSFLKESQRINSLGLVTFARKVLRPITLHDGKVLPEGLRIGVAASQINIDPELYPDPEIFDGFRFSKLREKAGCESRHQFVQTGLDAMNFGHGSHACPGRFFANNEMKCIFGYLIMNYDIALPEGQGRPENLHSLGGSSPDHSKTVMLKRRE